MDIRRMWEHSQAPGRSEWFKEVAGGTFAEYVEAARRRLAKHNFNEAFKLHENPKLQDDRVTWIEYLEFEYWWLDKYTGYVQHFQRQHDDAWKDLVASGVLRDGETEEDLFELLKGNASGPPSQQSTSRSEFIEQFRKQTASYRNAKAAESRQTTRVQWALSQMPKGSKSPKPTSQTKKRRHREDSDEDSDDVTEQPALKKKTKGTDGNTCPTKAAAPRGRYKDIASGLLSLPGAAWEVKDGKRRSTRVANAKACAQGANEHVGVLEEVVD